MIPVDLRSDTVTKPTPAMREAMMRAELGDDVLEGDPEALRLQALAARMTGKEAALWFPTGTMANQAAIAAWTRPGDAILAEQDAHVLFYEVGGPALNSGVMTWTLASDGGAMDPALVARRITRENLHTPGTALICLENTHNRAGGAVLPLAMMRETRRVADAAGVPVHLDGARVMNAVAGGGGSLMEIAREVDTLTICLSKGLGAPAGTVLCGPADLIAKALRVRKRLGGGMRQIGFLCAAGAFALEHQAARLAEDHARARRLAEALEGTPGITVAYPGTNMVLLTTESPAAAWQEALEHEGVRCLAAASDRLRLVTHHDVDDAGIERAVAAVHTVAGTLRGSPRAAALSSA